jgi:hypothetical protein
MIIELFWFIQVSVKIVSPWRHRLPRLKFWFLSLDSPLLRFLIKFPEYSLAASSLRHHTQGNSFTRLFTRCFNFMFERSMQAGLLNLPALLEDQRQHFQHYTFCWKCWIILSTSTLPADGSVDVDVSSIMLDVSIVKSIDPSALLEDSTGPCKHHHHLW